MKCLCKYYVDQIGYGNVRGLCNGTRERDPCSYDGNINLCKAAKATKIDVYNEIEQLRQENIYLREKLNTIQNALRELI